MNFVINEKIKHRIIGLAVIFSLVAIFAPAMMKKSSQKFENSLNMKLKLPAKPTEPNIAMADEDKVFSTVKVAHVDIPAVDAPNEAQQLAKAQPIQPLDEPQQLATADTLTIASAPVAKQKTAAVKRFKPREVKLQPKVKKVRVAVVKKPAPKAVVRKAVQRPKVVAKKAAPAAKLVANKDTYSVQLASFSSKTNAQALINRLKTKGYTGVLSNQGKAFKVLVGRAKQRHDAERLKVQLASAMQINGFIVTGVS